MAHHHHVPGETKVVPYYGYGEGQEPRRRTANGGLGSYNLRNDVPCRRSQGRHALSRWSSSGGGRHLSHRHRLRLTEDSGIGTYCVWRRAGNLPPPKHAGSARALLKEGWEGIRRRLPGARDLSSRFLPVPVPVPRPSLPKRAESFQCKPNLGSIRKEIGSGTQHPRSTPEHRALK